MKQRSQQSQQGLSQEEGQRDSTGETGDTSLGRSISQSTGDWTKTGIEEQRDT